MGETGTGGSLLGVGEGEREPAVAAMAVVCLHSSVVPVRGSVLSVGSSGRVKEVDRIYS